MRKLRGGEGKESQNSAAPGEETPPGRVPPEGGLLHDQEQAAPGKESECENDEKVDDRATVPLHGMEKAVPVLPNEKRRQGFSSRLPRGQEEPWKAHDGAHGEDAEDALPCRVEEGPPSKGMAAEKQ